MLKTHSDHPARRAEVLVDAGLLAEALALADAAVRREPERVAGHAARARALRALGRSEEALDALDALVARAPSALAHDARGVLLSEAGRLGEARAAFEAALRGDPRLARAHFGLATLGRVGAERLAALEALARSPDGLDDEARLFLIYALVRAYDEAGDCARAFVAAEAGARLRRSRWGGDEAEELRRLSAAMPGVLRGGGTRDGPSPIFVFGMPRSGTTLVEQILARHPDIVAVGETEIVDVEVTRGLHGAALAAACRARWRTGGKRVVDKSLGNFLHMGAIRRAFPRARLVQVRRDPLDACLSIHFTLFGTDMPFAPGLRPLGRYWRGYEALTAAWRAALPPDAMWEVGYERLVADPAGEARALLAFCGLAWDERCLDPAAAQGSVRTASLAQVRAPIHAGAVGRAKRYEAFLDDLRDALG